MQSAINILRRHLLCKDILANSRTTHRKRELKPSRAVLTGQKVIQSSPFILLAPYRRMVLFLPPAELCRLSAMHCSQLFAE